MSDFTIKRSTYCPVCRGIVLSDCPHTMGELRNALSGHTRSDYDWLVHEMEGLRRKLDEALQERDAMGADRDRLAAELSAAREDAMTLAVQVVADHGEPPRHASDPCTLFWYKRSELAATVIRAASSAGAPRAALDELHQMDHEDAKGERE